MGGPRSFNISAAERLSLDVPKCSKLVRGPKSKADANDVGVVGGIDDGGICRTVSSSVCGPVKSDAPTRDLELPSPMVAVA
jgi:hypothetical protein